MRFESKKIKILYHLLLITFFTNFTSAQTEEDKFNLIDKLPKNSISPEIASLGKFQQIEISPYTGTTDISIPLYTIKESNYEIPIVLRYHSSGIKVGEEASWVGLGWTLSPTGNITHTAIGELDHCDILPTMIRYNNLMNTGATNVLYDAIISRTERGMIWSCTPALVHESDDYLETIFYASHVQAGMPDKYFFSLPNSSGRFYLDPVTKVAKLFGKRTSEVFIKHTTLPAQTELFRNFSWWIFDMNGIRYDFNTNDIEWSKTNDVGAAYDPFYGSTTWWLSKITLPNGKIINMSYINDGITYSTRFSQKYRNSAYSTDIHMTENHPKYLQTIETENEKIVFELSSTFNERQDIKGETNDNIYTGKRLNAIHVYNRISNKKVKTFKFNYGYFESSGTGDSYNLKRLKLNSIQEIGYDETGNDNSTKSSYFFTYYWDHALPQKDSDGVDFWGYYNGRELFNTGLIPKLKESVLYNMITYDDIPVENVQMFFTQGNADRGMDGEFAISGLLKQITYPTGGYQIFTYEPNSFTNYGSKAANEFLEGNTIYTSFYALAGTHHSFSNLPNLSTTLVPDQYGKLTILNLKLSVKIIGQNINNFGLNEARIPRIYLKKTGTNTIVHTWQIPVSSIDDLLTSSGCQIEVGRYTYNGSPGESYYLEVATNLSSSLYDNTQSIPTGALLVTSSGYWFNSANIESLNERRNIGGGLRIKEQSTFDSNGKLVQKRMYSYVMEDGTTSSGKLVAPLRFYSNRNYVEKTYRCNPELSISTFNKNDFTISSSNYNPLNNDVSGAIVGYDRVEIKDIDLLNNTNGKTVNYYRNKPSIYREDNPLLPSLAYEDTGLADSVVFYDKNDNIVKRVHNQYYSIFDTTTLGVNVIDNYRGYDGCNPCGFGIYNPFAYSGRWSVYYYPLQTHLYMPLKTTSTIYSANTPTITVLNEFAYNRMGQMTSAIEARSDGNHTINRFTYPYDLSGYNSMKSHYFLRPLIHKEESVIAGTNEKKIMDLRYHYGAETNNSILGFVPKRITQYFENAADSVSINYKYTNNLQIAESYKDNNIKTVFLWGHNNTYLIAKLENIENSSISTELRDNINLLQNHTSITSSSARTNLKTLNNKIRNILSSNVMITTYTYIPLIGMTSQTDPNGVTTYYEYDEFGRLKYIKDDDGNILKSYEYHYKE